jgi:ComF family protein
MKVVLFSLPETCVLCGNWAVRKGPARPLCDACERELLSMPGPFLLPVGTTGITCYAAVEYAGLAKRAIEAVKYGGNIRMVNELVRLLLSPLVRELADDPSVSSFSGVVPVPASSRGRRSRGFDQTRVMARELGLPVDMPLRRRRRGLQQKRLSRNDRRMNADRQYVLTTRKAGLSGSGRSVLLVDDVVTTGASLKRCTELLNSRGYRVSAAVACTATL